jgi:hypothetical protein
MFGRFPGWRCVLAAGSLLVVGCRSAPGGGSGAAVRDSAGIAIVASDAPAWGDGKGWSVAEQPSFDVGGGSTPETDLSQVNGAVRLVDGRVAVASALANAVRVYDPQGKLVVSVGRPGAGPGEFQMLGGLWRSAGDSLLAADMMLQRLAVISPAGTFVRNFSLGGQSGLPMPTGGQFGFAIPVGRLADGSVIGMRMSFRVQGSGSESSYRDTVALVRYGPDGVARDTVGRFPGVEMTQTPLTFGGQTVSTPSPVPLGRQTVVGVGEDRVFVAMNLGWEVEVRSPAGTLERLIRLPSPAVPITEAEIAIHRKEQIALLEATPQMRAVPPAIKDQFLTRVNNAKYPATLPFIAGLFPVSDGTLWVEEVTRPGAERRRFAIFDREGALQGRVTAPPGFRVLTAYPDALIGVWKDADDVEHVRIHPVTR